MTLPGISFLRNGRFTIPVSMRPISLNFEDTFVSNFTEAPCNPCDAIDSFEITDSVTCSSSNAGRRYCYCYQLSAADIVELVQNEAIAQNFFLSLAPMTPPWLTINVFPSQRAHLEDSYITYIDDGNNLVNENLCVGFHDQDITDGLYSILKYRGDLGIVLDSDSVSHTPTGSSLFCFAVNNCEGYNSSILISLPEGHNFDSLPLFQAWKRHGWTTQLRGMTVNIQNDRSYDISLWNGYSDASFTLGPYHLSASGSLLGEWTVSDTLVVNFTTDGFFTVSVSDVNEMFANGLNQNITVLFTVAVELVISSVSSSFTLTSASTDVYLQLNADSAGNCQGSNVMLTTLTHSYAAQRNDFFARLFAIQSPGPGQDYSCPVDIALSLNSSAEVVGLAIRSTCHELVLGKLIFTGTRHVVSIGGSQSPAACDDSVSEGTLSEDMVVSTWEESPFVSQIMINNFISFHPTNNEPFVITKVYPQRETFEAEVNKLQFSFLGAVIQPLTTINEQQLRFRSEVTIFQYIPTDIVGTASVQNSWRNMELRLEGTITDSNLIGSIENNTRVLLQEVSARASDRIALATDSLNRAQHQLDVLEGDLQNANSTVNSKRASCLSLTNSIASTENDIEELEQEIESSGAAKELRDKLDQVCTVRTCGDVCVPGTSSAECTVPVVTTANRQCQTICHRSRQASVSNGYRYFIRYTTATSCGGSPLFGLACIPYLAEPTGLTFTACAVGIFFGLFRRCRSVDVPYVAKEVMYRSTTVQEAYDCLRPCEIIITTYTTQECTVVDECKSLAPDVDCIKESETCMQARDSALSQMENSPGSPAYLMKQLNDLQSQLTVLKARFDKCEVELSLAEDKLSQIERSFSRLSAAVELSEEQLEEVRRLNNAGETLNDLLKFYDISNIFEVNGITFDIASTEVFPSAFFLTVQYTLPYRHQTEAGSFMFDFNFKASSLHDLATKLSREVQRILTGSTNDRRKRTSASESLGIDWSDHCRNLHAIKVVLESALKSLRTVQEIQKSAMDNSTMVKEEISNYTSSLFDTSNVASTVNGTILGEIVTGDVHTILESLPNNVMLAESLNTVGEIFDEAITATDSLASAATARSFLEWQIDMEFQLNASSSVFGHQCVGLLDCLYTMTEILKEILDLAQLPITEDLLQKLPEAESDFVNLAYRADLTIEEALQKAEKILYIVSTASNISYWCAEKPSAKMEGEAEVTLNVIADSLTLSCSADSEWPVNFEWRKNNKTIPGGFSQQLHIPSIQLADAGVYSCVASNHIGSDTTIGVNVIVTAAPRFVEEPQHITTYAEEGVDLTLNCNATGFPDPELKWSYKSFGDDMPTFLDANSTELRLPSHAPHLSGVYQCIATNDKGATLSKEANLRILESSVTQFTLPVVVEFTKAGSSMEKRAVDVSYVDTGIDPLQYVTLEEEEGDSLAAKVLAIIEMEINVGNVSILKASFDNPSSPSSLTFLVGTRLIPIDVFHTIPLLDLFQNYTDAKNELQEFVEKLNPLLPYLNYSEIVESYDTAYGGVDTRTVISRCPPGQGLNNSNYIFCVACKPGEYQGSTADVASGIVLVASHTCLPCPEGLYQQEEGQTQCTSCEPGYTLSSPGESTCVPCAPGSYRASTGGTKCTLCPVDTYQPNEGQSSCMQCSDGYASPSAGSTQCKLVPTTTPTTSSTSPVYTGLAIGLGVGALAVCLLSVVVLLLVMYMCRLKKRRNKADHEEELAKLRSSLGWITSSEFEEDTDKIIWDEPDQDVDEISIGRSIGSSADQLKETTLCSDSDANDSEEDEVSSNSDTYDSEARDGDEVSSDSSFEDEEKSNTEDISCESEVEDFVGQDTITQQLLPSEPQLVGVSLNTVATVSCPVDGTETEEV
jgi:predicted  nucleic acid-binding Zn-ribbon protein